MKKLITLLLALVVLAACAAPTAEIVEKEVVVEKPVVQTVIVEKEKVVEKPVVQTVIVEKEVVVEKVVAPTPVAKPKVFRTLGGWDNPPAYHGNKFAPGGTGAAQDYIWGMLFGYDVVKGEFWPYLATDFEETPEAVTVHLRKDIKWEDGTPFTAKDVRTSFYVAGGALTWSHIWKYTEEIEAPDDYTVVFHWSVPGILVKKRALTEWIMTPHHIYEKWLSAAEELVKLRQEMWAKEAAGEDVTALKGAIEEKTAAFKESLAEYRPEKPMGYGLFRLKSVTADEMVLEKSPTFWAADEVAVDEVRMYKYTGNELAWAMIIAGDVDLEKPSTPPAVVDAILAAQPKIKLVPIPRAEGLCVAMNLTRYPFSEKDFRKALAYIIDRDKVRELARYYDSTVECPCGLLPSLLDAWASPDLKKELNPYPVDLAKAEELLKGLGMSKGADGFWVSPEEKPLEFEILGRQGYTDWIIAAEEIARQLTDFGIKTGVKVVEKAIFGPTLATQDYDMATEFSGNTKLHPAQGYELFYTPGQKIARISGFDPKVVGRAGETVDLSKLVDELMVTADPARQKEIVAELAWCTNEYLPIIEYSEKRAPFFLCDGVRVTGWPDRDELINKLGWNWRVGSVKWLFDGTLKAVP